MSLTIPLGERRSFAGKGMGLDFPREGLGSSWGFVGVNMMRCLIAIAVAVGALVLMLDSNVVGKDKEPVSIKAIMKKAHSGLTGPDDDDTLLGKVLEGTAKADEKKMLVALYTDLAKATPPMNDGKEWKDRTKALLDAAKADDVKALKKASNCKSCHEQFKKKKA
jgi:hypothetical protein